MSKVVGPIFAVVAGVASVAQLVSTTSPGVWLPTLAGCALLVGSLYLVWPFCRPTPPNPANPNAPTPVDRLEAVFAILAVIGIAAASVGIGGWALGAVGGSAPESISLDSPGDVHQAREFTATGNVSGLKLGETVWVLVSPIDDSEYYVQEGPCLVKTEGQWSCEGVTLGPPTQAGPTAYHVHAGIADSTATLRFVNAWRTFSGSGSEADLDFNAKPDGVTLSGPVTLTRDV